MQEPYDVDPRLLDIIVDRFLSAQPEWRARRYRPSRRLTERSRRSLPTKARQAPIFRPRTGRNFGLCVPMEMETTQFPFRLVHFLVLVMRDYGHAVRAISWGQPNMNCTISDGLQSTFSQ